MALGIGDPAGAHALLTPAGERTSLVAFRGEATVLIFLRHLG